MGSIVILIIILIILLSFLIFLIVIPNKHNNAVLIEKGTENVINIESQQKHNSLESIENEMELNKHDKIVKQNREDELCEQCMTYEGKSEYGLEGQHKEFIHKEDQKDEIMKKREIEYDKKMAEIRDTLDKLNQSDYQRMQDQELKLFNELIHNNSDSITYVVDLKGENKLIAELINNIQFALYKKDYDKANELIANSFVPQKCKEYGEYIKVFYKFIRTYDYSEPECLLEATRAICLNNTILAYCFIHLCNNIIVNR